ncbi:transcriptional regulator [Sphaerisporangium rufum]|uniref:Transcriptional regulator n=1 Tax=Sphaerisporangium rufum TaxID=1381558 RepID=A0A919R8L1_9ACTN|nr:transcriptional regulator [Sphaerisporangium rufum]GII79252.1 transcriptional regulator [Sphaerisporangium rufum]
MTSGPRGAVRAAGGRRLRPAPRREPPGDGHAGPAADGERRDGMGWWRVNADTLAGSRFVTSPLAEVTACLILLQKVAPANAAERRWLAAHLPAHRAELAADPPAALLLRAALRPRWIADFLIPTPTGEEETFEAEVARVRRSPPEQVQADLAVALGGPPPAPLCRDDLAERAAALLERVWRESVRPYWPRRRRILQADIVARSGRAGRAGWVAALDGMRPGMRWLGEGRLQINAYDYPPRDLAGARLLFVPVTAGRGWVSSRDGRFAVMYPCAGALADPDRPAPAALGRLLGPGRAAVLVLLADPLSTTHLVALTGQGLGSVGRHLKVLLDAGLVHRRRAGRSVLYYRTAAGDALVRAQRPDPPADAP